MTWLGIETDNGLDQNSTHPAHWKMSLACAFKLDDTNAKGQTVMPAAWIKQQYLTPLELDQSGQATV